MHINSAMNMAGQIDFGMPENARSTPTRLNI